MKHAVHEGDPSLPAFHQFWHFSFRVGVNSAARLQRVSLQSDCNERAPVFHQQSVIAGLQHDLVM